MYLINNLIIQHSLCRLGKHVDRAVDSKEMNDTQHSTQMLTLLKLHSNSLLEAHTGIYKEGVRQLLQIS